MSKSWHLGRPLAFAAAAAAAALSPYLLSLAGLARPAYFLSHPAPYLWGALVIAAAITAADAWRRTPGRGPALLAVVLAAVAIYPLCQLPKFLIYPLDDPPAVPAEEAALQDEALVIGVQVAGQARAYPLTLLTQHEVINDLIGATPLIATY